MIFNGLLSDGEVRDKVTSWSYAFKRGLIIWLWTIVWAIIGGLIALAISGGAVLALILNPTGSIATGAVAGIIAGVFVGVLISSIGNYATLVKIILESEQKTKQ